MAENPSGPAKPLDVQRIHYLVRLMKRYDLTALDVSDSSVQIRLRRRSPRAGVASRRRPAAGDRVRPRRRPPALTASAPPRPESPPHRRLGGPEDGRDREPHGRYLLFLERTRCPDRSSRSAPSSSPSTIVCIIEAMKVFTDIPAGVSGTIAEILVKNGQAVEFGQPLFRVIPA